MTPTKSVLFFAPSRHTYDEFCSSIGLHPSMRVDSGEALDHWHGPELALRMEPVGDAATALARIRTRYYNLVVVDCRHLPHAEADPTRQESALRFLLAELRAERDRERRYPFQRVVVLVGDEDEERVDRLIFSLGQQHVGACVRDLALCSRRAGADASETRVRMFDRLWSLFHELLVAHRGGKKAISLAGGGATGVYYEFGVLKCLDDAFDIDIRDLDMFLGISAGAIVVSCLANGYPIDEIIAHAGELNGGRGLQRRVNWTKLNLREVPRRLWLAQRHLATDVGRMLRMESSFDLATLLGASGTLLGPMFDNRDVERFLRRLFSRPGHTNDFRQLRRELFIGSTDQDRREHVLFGENGFRDVPISRAVQASASVHPFFPSVGIGGRQYTDGVVTRTSNLGAAIQHGADLVFIIDPFVPLISDQAGYNARHGNLWIIEQDFKTLAYTRFELASEEILRSNPQVNAYAFVPGNRMRRLMSQNPFAARNFHPIVCESYKSTYRRLRLLEYKIGGELASHGIRLDLRPVEKKVRRLEALSRPDVGLLIDPDRGTDRRVRN